MKVYIGDILVKSTEANDQLDHLKEAFEILQKYNMKLNLENEHLELAQVNFSFF